MTVLFLEGLAAIAVSLSSLSLPNQMIQGIFEAFHFGLDPYLACPHGNIYVTMHQCRFLNISMQLETVRTGTGLRASMLKPPRRSLSR
jgi:hypothetical protein